MTVLDPATGKRRFSIVPAAYVFLLRTVDDETAAGAGSGHPSEVLLQLRQNTGYMDDHWAAAAAGHVEQGETAADAARREALEEIGVADLALEFATAMQRTAHDLAIDERVDFFFTARSWMGAPRIVEPAKCAELRWVRLDALDELPGPVVPHERFALESLLSGDLPPLSSFGF